MEFLHIQFWSLNSKVRINNGTKQDDPKPLLTKYWISPLAIVTVCPPGCLSPTPNEGHALITNKHIANAQLAIQETTTRKQYTQTNASFNTRKTRHSTFMSFHNWCQSCEVNFMIKCTIFQTHPLGTNHNAPIHCAKSMLYNFKWLWWPLCRWCWTEWSWSNI